MNNTTDPAGPAAPPPTGGAPGPGDPGHAKGHALDGFYDGLRRPGILRPTDGRWFAGVASGIANRLGVDPLVIRAAFILFGLFFGAGIALYLVLWLLMPDDRGRLSIEQALKHGEGGSIFLLVVTAIAVLGGGPWDGDMQGMRIVGLVLLGGGAWFFLTRTDSGRQMLEQIRSRQPSAGSATAAGPATSPAAASAMSTGNAAANAGATLPPPTVVPVTPPAPRVRTRTIGFAPGLLVLGLAVVTAAAIGHSANTFDWPGNHMAVGVAAGLAVLGLGIVGAGVAGRRSGWLAPFAVAGIITSVTVSVLPAGIARPWEAGERQYRVTSLDVGAYSLAAGELSVDLSDANYQATPGPDTVEAVVGVGELQLVVPDGVHVVVNAKGAAGEVVAFASDAGVESSRDGTSWREQYTYGGATSAKAEIVVNAEVGLGQITIRKEATS